LETGGTLYYFGMEPYDWESEGFESIDLPQPDVDSFANLVHFLVEVDRKEKRMNREIVQLVEPLFDKYGQDAAISIMNYVQQKQGWDLEILMERYEVENHLMSNYNLFDDSIFLKVLGTNAMYEYRRKVFSLSQTYLARAVREVLEKERPDTSVAGDPLL
jgi:hypothetical protein